jgi:hypothetical protein
MILKTQAERARAPSWCSGLFPVLPFESYPTGIPHPPATELVRRRVTGVPVDEFLISMAVEDASCETTRSAYMSVLAPVLSSLLDCKRDWTDREFNMFFHSISVIPSKLYA